MNISITKTTTPKVKPDPSTLGFGKVFTDHMFLMEYEPERGWYDARIVPFGNLSIHPAATVLHYGSEIFEGLKAYRRADGKVQMFRPIENIRRLNRSAERLCLPELPEELGMEVLTAFVNMEQDWTPSAPGTSLYLRPLMFGNDETLGVHAVHHTTFMIIASPVGSYYKEGINPVGIMIEDQDVRAVKGGTGYTKCGGNYAASNRAGHRAKEYFDRYGVDAVMIGRATYGHPWIFKEIRHYLQTGELLPQMSVLDRVALAKRHLAKSVEIKGDRVGILEMRRHLSCYFKGLPDFKETRLKLVTLNDTAELYSTLDYIAERWGEEIAPDAGNVYNV